jgi:hypothetical protein
MASVHPEIFTEEGEGGDHDAIYNLFYFKSNDI